MKNLTTIALALVLAATVFAMPSCDTSQPAPTAKTAGAAMVDEGCRRLGSLSQADQDTPAGCTKRVTAPMPEAKKAFIEVYQLILDNYVDKDISEDELWTGAVAGMLGRLIQLRNRRVNALLDPKRLARLTGGLSGSFSGIGVAVKKVEGVLIVREVMHRGPADNAGIRPGDRILTIDGQPVEKLALGEIVRRIRGRKGTLVKLLVQHGTEERVLPVTRGKVSLEPVTGQLVAGTVAYVRITSYNRKTLTALDDVMEGLMKKGARSMLLDLRNCPGGLLSVAIESTSRFLPAGKRIVSVKGRDGSEKVHLAKGPNPYKDLPMVALIDASTASGAEIMAAALAENGRTLLVGQPTLGKSTVEKVTQLANGWAVKLSVGRFYSPKGNQWHGTGIIPDFAVSGTSRPTKVFTDPAAIHADADAYIKAGLKVLELKRAR